MAAGARFALTMAPVLAGRDGGMSLKIGTYRPAALCDSAGAAHLLHLQYGGAVREYRKSWDAGRTWLAALGWRPLPCEAA